MIIYAYVWYIKLYIYIYNYYIGNISHWLRSMNAGWTPAERVASFSAVRLARSCFLRTGASGPPSQQDWFETCHETSYQSARKQHPTWMMGSKSSNWSKNFLPIPSYIIYQYISYIYIYVMQNFKLVNKIAPNFGKPPSRPKVQNLCQLVACVRILRLQLHHGLQVLAKSAEEKWRLSRLN